MLKFSKSYILSVLLTAFMATCVCAQEQVPEGKAGKLPSIGDAFPHLQLTDTKHQTMDIYDYLHNEPVVLIYYRGGW